MEAWEILLGRLERAVKWPLNQEKQIRAQIALWAALRESDEATLRRIMEWPGDRHLIIDNLPEKIAVAFGDLLFGETPIWTAAEPGDQERLEDFANTWSDELQAAEETCVSEGEVWWRISLNPDAGPHPILTWHSRADVVPLLHGREVVACAFVSQLESTNASSATGDEAAGNQEVWRHVEIHGRGRVENFLFRGRPNLLGQRQDLAGHPETADLAPSWEHGIAGLLAGRIVNRYGRRPYAGVSIYNGVWTKFLTLNEAQSIGRENLRLTAKKRVIVPASAVRTQAEDPIELPADGRAPRQRARFDAGEDVIVHDPLDQEEGVDGGGPFKVLEYSFDAEALISYKRDLVEDICQRCDIVPQFIGSGDFGQAQSGTALRVRLLPTTNAAEGRGKRWDAELPNIALLAQLLEAAPATVGGIGRTEWAQPAEKPGLKRRTPLPEDPNETALRQATLKRESLLSVEESVRERHQHDWSEDQILEEVDRIRADTEASLPSISFGGSNEPPPGSGA